MWTEDATMLKFSCGQALAVRLLPLYPIPGYVGDAVALRGQALAFFMRPGIGGEALPLYLWIRRRRRDFMRPGIGGEVTSQ
ncbi:unnamed protein product [Rhizophagus irregularis]|nr:unnamed protein product [Rhizophagus irregularis]